MEQSPMAVLSGIVKKVLLGIGCTVVSLCLASCTTEEYEAGDGEYSYMRADFVETKTNQQGAFVSAVTDDGEALTFDSPFTVSWKAASDSTYRALLYYKKKSQQVEPMSVSVVSVPNVRKASSMKTAMKVDPVQLESMWQSKQNEYLNLGITLKTGKPDDADLRHVIGVICDTIVANAGNHRHVHLRLYHDQNNVPEYYSSHVYISVPMKRIPDGLEKGDTVSFAVNCYDGKKERVFVY